MRIDFPTSMAWPPISPAKQTRPYGDDKAAAEHPMADFV
jgi:hypothetical protein